MSTSDRPPAGGSARRQSTADDAAPAALSLPHEERLALARKLLARGAAASVDGAPTPRETRTSRGRRASTTSAEPWADLEDFPGDEDLPKSTSPRRRAGSIRRTAENEEAAETARKAAEPEPGQRQPQDAAVRRSTQNRSDAVAAAKAFAADDDLPTRTRAGGSHPVDPWAGTEHAATPEDRPGRTRGGGCDAVSVDPWADAEDAATPDDQPSRRRTRGSGSNARPVDPWADADDAANSDGLPGGARVGESSATEPVVGEGGVQPDAEGAGVGRVSEQGSSSEGSSGAEGSSGSGGRGSGRLTAARRPLGGRRASRRAAEEPDGPADPGLDQAADPQAVARTILLDKLTGQPRTRAELADLLAEREIPEDVAEEVLDRFTEVGLIDDAAFANAWVESRHRGRGLGKRALAQELRRRGVDDEQARDALDELDPEQEEETARTLVRRKLRSMRSLDRDVAMRRLLGMLARKGYPGGLAMSIIKQELDAGHEELPLLDSSGLEPD